MERVGTISRYVVLGGMDDVLSQSAMNFGHKRENVDS